MSYSFENDKQRTAAKYILARSAIEPSPNKRQLTALIESKGDYDTKKTARQFVKNFVNNSSSPLEEKGLKIVRKDIDLVSSNNEVGL